MTRSSTGRSPAGAPYSRPSRTSSVSGSTIGMPSRSDSSTCSYQAPFSSPSEIRAIGTSGSPSVEADHRGVRARHLDLDHLRLQVLRGLDHASRHRALADDALLGVGVADEGV